MTEIKKQFYMRWDEIAVYFMLEIGSFVFGEVLLWIVVYVAGEKESIFPIGTVIALFLPAFVMLFAGMSSFPMCFNTAVSMGATRRRIVPAIFCVSLAMNLIVAWNAGLLYQLEKWIFRMVYAGIQVEDDLGFLFRWKYILPACLVIVAVNALMGALFMKLGKAAYTIFWILWMVVFVGGPRLWKLMQGEQENAFLRLCRSIAGQFMQFSIEGILAAVAAVSLVLAIAAWILLRRQQVL